MVKKPESLQPLLTAKTVPKMYIKSFKISKALGLDPINAIMLQLWQITLLL